MSQDEAEISSLCLGQIIGGGCLGLELALVWSSQQDSLRHAMPTQQEEAISGQ